ncbi:helix-turn-helix domain-containing protein [Rhodococcus opacus]|uniref:helix-turn-helix domain-containing protein n=1 Tax=Rhodococcus opacus TaxID=37919 RepID=UPI001C7D1DD9|nr:helix-turn-helix domain-containing protein [Rhodococcus opacus]
MPGPDRYLSLLEGEGIAVPHAQQCSVREIARRLNRAASTISRELRRNVRAGDDGNYGAGLSHSRAREKARRHRRSIFARHSALRTLGAGQARAAAGAGEQIAGWLRTNTQIDRTGTSVTKRSSGACITAEMVDY